MGTDDFRGTDDDDPGSRDTKFAFIGMALLIGVLIVVSILSQVLD
jgi:hypothetical protein